MARMPELLDLLASFGHERKTVELQARVLREAGILSRGKRGSGAPSVTASDAAALLLAGMTSGRAVAAPDTVRGFRAMGRKAFAGSPRGGRGERELGELCAGAATPQAALRALIDAAGRADPPAFLDAAGGGPRLRVRHDRVAGTFSVLLEDPSGSRGARPREPSFACTWTDPANPPRDDALIAHVVTLSGRAIREVAAIVHGAPLSRAWPAVADLPAEEPETAHAPAP